MSDDRISKLSERFRTHSVGRKPTATRNRERTSFYIDGELVSRLDRAYRDMNHAFYPESVNKSAFLETLMEYGLQNLDEIAAILRVEQGIDDPTSK